ncbi:hypothetical protein ACFQU7_30450 [Pseudoroseomonas wenyumeiae]
MMTPIRVLLADDSTFMRLALRRIVERRPTCRWSARRRMAVPPSRPRPGCGPTWW